MRRNKRIFLSLGAMVPLFAFVACAMGRSRADLDRDIASFPPDRQEQFRMVSLRCNKCHELANRILQVGDEEDIMVHRMARKSDANIPEADIPVIVDFLRYYAANRPRSAKP